MYSEAHVLTLLKRMRLELGTATAMAEKLGVEARYLPDILRGTRTLSPKVLERLGLERLRVYVPLTMPEAEREARLAWARLGHVGPDPAPEDEALTMDPSEFADREAEDAEGGE